MINKLEEKIKNLIPRIRDTNIYLGLVEILQSNNAYNKKYAVKTKDIEAKIGKSIGSHLTRMETAKIVRRIKKSAACFIVDSVDKTPKRFAHTETEIRRVIEKRTNELVNQIKRDKKLLKVCAETLRLDEGSGVEHILQEIMYPSDKNGTSLGNYNQLVRKLKKEGIRLIGFDELIWKRGGHRWYLTDEFIEQIQEEAEHNTTRSNEEIHAGN